MDFCIASICTSAPQACERYLRLLNDRRWFREMVRGSLLKGRAEPREKINPFVTNNSGVQK